MTANGQALGDDGLIVCPPGHTADLVVPCETSADSLTIPVQRFYKIAESISPDFEVLNRFTIVRGDVASLHRLRRKTRMLLHEPLGEQHDVCIDNLIAEWVAWLGQPDAMIERNRSPSRQHRAQIARQARAYFIDHYRQPIKLEDACGELGVGLRTLQRCSAD